MYDIFEGIRGHFSKAKLIFVVILLYHAKNGNTIKTVFFFAQIKVTHMGRKNICIPSLIHAEF